MRYFLYYAGYEKSTGLEQIGLATSSDLKKWNRPLQNPVIPAGSAGECDNAQTSNPCVLRIGNLFKMWYQGKSSEGFLSVCYGESSDGIIWKVHQGPILSSSSAHGFRSGYHQPHVLYDAFRNIYRMWVVLYENGQSSLSYLESSDGIAWKTVKNGVLLPQEYWEGKRLFYPFIKELEGRLVMWYTGRSEGHRWAIGRAYSTDGFSWKKDSTNPLLPKRRSSEIFRRISDILAPFRWRLFTATYGSASPFVFDFGGELRMFTHDTGSKKRLSTSLYGSRGGDEWKPIEKDILREGAHTWESYFQADPFLVIIPEAK